MKQPIVHRTILQAIQAGFVSTQSILAGGIMKVRSGLPEKMRESPILNREAVGWG